MSKKLECLEPQILVEPPNFYNMRKSCCIQSTIRLSPIQQANQMMDLSSSFPGQKFTFLKQSFSDRDKNLVTTKGELKYGSWTDEEHKAFLKGYSKHGNHWSLIAKEFVFTRTREQIASHAQKALKKTIGIIIGK
jgi:SHAQKYF class myb-like DNA-binding protein